MFSGSIDIGQHVVPGIMCGRVRTTRIGAWSWNQEYLIEVCDCNGSHGSRLGDWLDDACLIVWGDLVSFYFSLHGLRLLGVV